MVKLARWAGIAGLAFGGALVVADIIMRLFGLSPSYNLGDPTKFEFYLISLWQIGLAAMAIGVFFLGLARRHS